MTLVDYRYNIAAHTDTKVNDMHAGDQVKKALIDARKSQTWLGEQLGISRQAAHYLCNQESVQSETLDKVAKILNISLSDLMC